jgi:peroxiredoxin (alkyl hydroperoxide reductase subunit C)
MAQVQKKAPDFEGTVVVDGKFQKVRLADFEGRWLVLVFIPMAFTFVCPTEIVAFSEAVQQFTERDAQVVIASTDSEFSLLGWVNADTAKGGLGPVQVPLFADRNHKLSREYGVLLEDEGIALRGTFIVDPRGVVRHSSINDLPVGRSVDEVLRLIDALQFTDKHGEVCPVNWRKGDKAIKVNGA